MSPAKRKIFARFLRGKIKFRGDRDRPPRACAMGDGDHSGGGGGSRHVESMSIEETNRQRAKLGLKPLNYVPVEEKAARERAQRAAAARSAQKQAENEAIRERLARRKRDRLLRKTVAGGSLGEQLGGVTGGSAADWVKRSRAMAARQTADRFEARDREEEEAAEAVAKKEAAKKEAAKKEAASAASYTSRDLRGIRVAHGADDFAEGKQVILTLADAPILDGEFGAQRLAEAEDVLENVNMVDAEKLKKLNDAKKKLLRPKYDVYGDDPNRAILSHYDQDDAEGAENKNSGMRIGEDDPDSEEERRRRAERVRARLRKRRPSATPAGVAPGAPGRGPAAAQTATTASENASRVSYSLAVERRVASDYQQPRERPKKFKKRKKKKKAGTGDAPRRASKRTRTTSTLDFLPEPSGAADRQVHHGSRAQGNVALQRRRAEERRARKDEKDAGYLRALNKAEAQSFVMPAAEPSAGDDGGDFIDDDDAYDAELQAALARARKAGAQRRVKTEDRKDHASVIAETVMRSEQSGSGGGEKSGSVLAARSPGAKDAQDGIIFTSTTEFCRGLEASELKQEATSKIKVHDAKADNAVAGRTTAAAMDVEVVDVKPPPLRSGGDAPAAAGGSSRNGVPPKPTPGSHAGTADDEEDDEDGVAFLHDEPLASTGMAAVLQLAKRRGMLSQQKQRDAARNVSIAGGGEPFKVRLNYTDEYGREMTAKDAYKKLSHKFHGKAPGKKKQEKRMRQYLLQIAAKRSGNLDDPGSSAARLRSRQVASGKAFLLLDRKDNPEDREQLLKDAAKLAKKKRKKAKKKAKLAKKNAARNQGAYAQATES